MELYDMHCHLDFLEDPRAFAREAAGREISFFAATVTPDGFLAARDALAGEPNVFPGVGLHPWWVHDGRCGQPQVDAACQLVAQTRFVGEIGLDFGKRCAPSRDAQMRAFRQVAGACAVGGKLLTIHAVRAADAVLDVLEDAGCIAGNRIIFHWFTDSSTALWRAVRAGCFFSVNGRMLATKRGREYARVLPANRLLLETDLPPEAEPAFSLDSWEADLRQTLDALESIRGERLAHQLAETSRQLLQEC